MAEYRLSARAATILEDIYVHTTRNFGEAQAGAYHEGFHRTFGLLADFPFMGQSADEYIIGMRKYRHQSHLIFYMSETNAIIIQHVIHYRQDVRKHLLDK